MATDHVDQSAWNAEPLPGDVPEVMRFAELYPAIPLRTLVEEVLHAQSAVAVGAPGRTEIVDQIVTTRLASYRDEPT
jgi:hypothetical protein